MGQRANLVIVRGGAWRLYYDHWCANRLDVELFWGPELAVEFIEQRGALADPGDWLDEVWCEGGAIVDEDRRILLWFGGEDIAYDVPLRTAYLDLMRTQWPGWEIRWAAGGIQELGEYLGLPKSMFLVDSEPGGSFAVNVAFPEDNLTLFTVEAGTVTRATRVQGDGEALSVGVAQLPTLLAFKLESSLVWRGDFPTGGIHLNRNTQALHFWLANPAEDILERVWPGRTRAAVRPVIRARSSRC